MPGSSAVSLIFLAAIGLFALLPLVLSLRRPANVDSPWFWGYWFGVFALVALLLAWPKYRERQAYIEREYQGRTRAAQKWQGEEPDVAMSEPGKTEITLGPLAAGLAAITVASWVVYFWTRNRVAPSAASGDAPLPKASPP